MSIGFNNCGRVTMPLAPNLGLIIHRTGRQDLRSLTAAEFNRATIYNSREFIAHHPNGMPSTNLQRALLVDLQTQRRYLPIFIDAAHSAAEKDARGSARQYRQLKENDSSPF